jgi:hypothetical protein
LEKEEMARKGREIMENPEGNDCDPEGMSEDELLDVDTDEKETQTGDFQADMAIQATTESRNAASQTGRRFRKIGTEDVSMIKSGQYLAIRAGRKAADNTRAIGNMGHGEGVRVKVEEGGFCNPNDARIRKTVLRFRNDNMMTVSCSFEPKDMTCSNCLERGRHSVLNGKDGGPVVFVGTDQNFPAVLPSLDEDNCVSIVRVEDGSLRDITWAVIDLLSNIRLPDKTTILLGSMSSLAARGIQTYGEDLVWGIRMIKEKLGERVNASAIPPILINGIESPSLVRSLAEAEIWFEGLKGPDGALLRRTRGFLLTEIERWSLGRVQSPEEHMVTMPDAVLEYNRVPTALMGWKGVGEQVAPFPQEVEAAQVLIMRDELEKNFGVTVTRNFDLRRTVEDGEAADYVVIGGSHGGNLARLLLQKGRKVIDLSEKGMRISAEVVEKLERRIAEAGEDEPAVDEDMVVILWVMDNSLYFVEDEDGARYLPKRGDDGKYHIEGQLKLATGKQAVKAMEKLLPLLRLLKKNRKLILVPTPRNVCQACCQDKGHCTNRREEGFLSGILGGLKDIRRAIRDACHEWRVANYKVVNGCTLLGLQEDSSYEAWEGDMGSDPVHLTDQGYGKLAESIFQMAEGIDAVFSGGKRELEVEEDRPAPTIMGRRAWVYGGEGRGGGRGGQGGQGGRGAPRGGRAGGKVGSHAGGYGFSPASGTGASGSGGYGYGGYGGQGGFGNKKR